MFTFGSGTLNEWCVSVFPDAAAPTILRGDASGDGTVSGLGDGLFLLRWQFVEDSPAPGCMAAADANADGTATGLVDGLFLLRWQFVEDSPAPSRSLREDSLASCTVVVIEVHPALCRDVDEWK